MKANGTCATTCSSSARATDALAADVNTAARNTNDIFTLRVLIAPSLSVPASAGFIQLRPAVRREVVAW